MKYYWSDNDIPELTPLSTADRRKVQQESRRLYPEVKKAFWVYLATVVAVGFASAILLSIVSYALGIRSQWVGAIGAGFGVVFGRTAMIEKCRPFWKRYIESHAITTSKQL